MVSNVDPRNELVQEVIYSLVASDINNEVIGVIRNVLESSLANYEVTNRCTDLVVADNESDKLIMMFKAYLVATCKSEGTIYEYIRQVERLYYYINKPLREVTNFDIMNWMYSLKDSTSPRTLNNYCFYLSAFYRYLHKNKLIAENPMDLIESIKYQRGNATSFSDTEIDRIRSSCKTLRSRAEIEVLLSTGVRVSELVSLNISDINWADLSVNIRNGKGNKQRYVYMNEVTAMHLKSYLDTRVDNDVALFYGKRKSRVSKSTITRDLNKISIISGVKDIHPHKFRHTFATTMYRRGMDINDIRILMGHATIQQTMEYITTDLESVRNKYRLCA